MVVSDKNKYVFIELPLTGCTAVSQELCLNYDGEPVLSKHATYRDFLKVATDEQKSYFAFSGIRCPLERTASQYEKYLSNHKQRHTDKNWLASRKGFYRSIDRRLDVMRFEYIQEHPGDFASYFKRFYWFPYDNWSRLDHEKLQFLIRFEAIQEGFSEVLARLNLEQKRPLPVVNSTKKRGASLDDYYGANVQARAMHVFGPFMKKWNYDFPESWGHRTVSCLDTALFEALGLVRKVAWLYLRPNTATRRKNDDQQSST